MSLHLTNNNSKKRQLSSNNNNINDDINYHVLLKRTKFKATNKVSSEELKKKQIAQQVSDISISDTYVESYV